MTRELDSSSLNLNFLLINILPVIKPDRKFCLSIDQLEAFLYQAMTSSRLPPLRDSIFSLLAFLFSTITELTASLRAILMNFTYQFVLT